jgi:hypothetical protein
MTHDLDITTFDREGFAVLPDAIRATQAADLKEALADAGAALRRRNGRLYGARNLLGAAIVRDLVSSSPLAVVAEKIVGPAARPVRALFFDKTPEANWPVLWHQDLTIAVASRHDMAGWGRWSAKAGVQHVEPPSTLLSSMATIRVHLDDCGTDNGPLKVLPGTHRLGRLSRTQIDELRRRIAEVECVAADGALVVMRPLLLHASSSARRPSHRRVLHIEYAPPEILPAPLEWAAAVH